jgi:hypothetical protein
MLGGLRPFSYDASRLHSSREEHSRYEALLFFVKVAAGQDSGLFVVHDDARTDQKNRPP